MESFINAAIQYPALIRPYLEKLIHNPTIKEGIRLTMTPGPIQLLALFFISSLVMIHRLNAVEQKGFEGTVVGTLIMPYCSGFANLAFALILARSGGDGGLVLENCLVNNATNLTLMLGIPALVWGLTLTGADRARDQDKLNRLSLLLTLVAMIFFTGILWLLTRDGSLDRTDGIILTALFLFWQVLHLFEVMKSHVRNHQPFKKSILVDLLLAGLCAWGTYISIEGLVAWVMENGTGFLSREYLGFLSGILMVVPNGLLAFYYAATQRPDIAYSSQVGDCHICIPLCIGLFAIFSPISTPASFDPGILLILGAGGVHFIFTAAMGRLPRLLGAGLTVSYGVFIFQNLAA